MLIKIRNQLLTLYDLMRKYEHEICAFLQTSTSMYTNKHRINVIGVLFAAKIDKASRPTFHRIY